jgi:hypothetical protein
MANTLNDFVKMIDTIHIYSNMMMIQTQIIRNKLFIKNDI